MPTPATVTVVASFKLLPGRQALWEDVYRKIVQGAQHDPAPVRDLKERIRATDALLIASPEYNYNVPGVLKNAIDWASRPPHDASVLYHKPIALMGASTGHFGTARSQLSWRQTFLFTTSHVILDPQVYVFRAAERFDAEGKLTDEDTRTFIRHLVEQLVKRTRELQEAGEAPRPLAHA